MRTLTPQEQAERVILRTVHDSFEKWRNGRTSYKTEEVPPGLEITNAQRSRLEVLDFIADPPDRYFAYVKTERIGEHSTGERIVSVTTWTGDKLSAEILTEGADFRSSFGDTRCNFRFRAINGATYSGTYYKSAGDYCRLRKMKGTK